jgi:hypothetical protein
MIISFALTLIKKSLLKASSSYPSPHGEGGQTIEYFSTKELSNQLMKLLYQVLCAVPSPRGEG